MDLSGQELQSLYNAYVLYNNWGSMSPAQKSKAIMTLGLQGYRFASGKDLATEYIVKPSAANGNEGLTFGQAFQLFGTGINAYSLAKNWKQMNDIQKIAGGAQFANSVAATAKGFGLLGAGTQGTAAATATAAQLTSQGWSQASGYGVGAVTAQAGTKIPQGYTLAANGGDGLIAVPAANASSSGGAVTGGAEVSNGMSDAARGAQAIAGAYNVYAGAEKGGVAGYGQAAAGGLQAYGAYANNASYGGYAGAVMQGVGAYSDWTSGQYTSEEIVQETQKRVGLAVADVYTGGLASTTANVFKSTPLGQKTDQLYNKIDSKVNPMTFLGGKALGKLGIGGGSKTKDNELNRLRALKEQGIDIPDAVLQGLSTPKGSSKADLIARAEATGGNVEFARSRKEDTLRTDDILNSATFVEKYPDWFKKSAAERNKIGQEVLDQGLVREHHGTIDVDWEGFKPSQTPRQRQISPDAKYLTQNAQKVYGGWINHDIPKEGNGTIGGSAFVAGLSKMNKDNPYMSSAIEAYSLANDLSKKGTTESRHNKRAIMKALKNEGLLTDENTHMLSDGTESEVSTLQYNFKDSDYDYLAGLIGAGGLSLKSGKKGKGLSEAGVALGMSWLGNVPKGAKLMPETFAAVQQNARAGWAKLGINSKADAYQLANQAFAEDRFDAFDHHRLQRTADYVFDDDGFNKFQNTLGGKNRGIEVALEVSDRPLSSPSAGNIDPGRIPSNIQGSPQSRDPGRVPANIAPQTSSPIGGVLSVSRDDVIARNRNRYAQPGMGV